MQRLPLCIIVLLIAISLMISSCGVKPAPKNVKEILIPDVGVTIKVGPEWTMTVFSGDERAFNKRLSHMPEYIFWPITCAKGTPNPDTLSRTPNWRFIGLTGEFDPDMSCFSPDYPKPDGLYFVGSIKGELEYQYKKVLPWPGAKGIEAVVREYEETHGAGGVSDIWHAYTVTFNYNGSAMEFNMRIPSDADTSQWQDYLWESITDLILE